MSAVLYSASGNNASLQGTTVGGTKPLHRFIKAQPKIIGVIVMIIGCSFFSISVSGVHFMTGNVLSISPGILLGLLFITCGILYILTEHHPSKKTVTMSLALTIVTILWSGWIILSFVPLMIHHLQDRHEYFEENTTENEDPAWRTYHVDMILSIDVILLLYCFVGAIILVVMSVMAGVALRSTKSQAMVVMTAAPTVTQDGQQAEEEGLNCEKMDA